MGYCYVTELHAYDFARKDFVIKQGRSLCQTLPIHLDFIPLCLLVPPTRNALSTSSFQENSQLCFRALVGGPQGLPSGVNYPLPRSFGHLDC